MAFRVARWAAAFVVAGLLLAGYILLGAWNLERFEAGVAPITLWTAWDRRVDPIEWTIWFYFIYYLLIFAPIFAARRPRQVGEILTAYLLVTLVAWFAWWRFPVRMVYPELACTGISCRLLIALYDLDAGLNVMPSLHAAHSMLAWAILRSYGSRAAPAVLAGALAVSTAAWLTGQHYIVDLPPGIALGLAGWWLTRWSFARADEWRAQPVSAPQPGLN